MALPTKRQRTMLSYALKHKLSDEVITRIHTDSISRAEVYGSVLGRHPTKKGK